MGRLRRCPHGDVRSCSPWRRTCEPASVRTRLPEKGAHNPSVSYTHRMSDEAWALVFMMSLLKIPIIYLGWVVWYAIKAEPEPGVDPHESSAWKPWSRPPRPAGPSGTRPAARRAARHGAAVPVRRVPPGAVESGHERRPTELTERIPARTDAPVEAVAGLMAAGALFLGVLELAYRPFRLAPVAVILLLAAAVMSKDQQRLIAVGFRGRRRGLRRRRRAAGAHAPPALSSSHAPRAGSPGSPWYNTGMSAHDVDGLNTGYARALLDDYLENPAGRSARVARAVRERRVRRAARDAPRRGAAARGGRGARRERPRPSASVVPLPSGSVAGAPAPVAVAEPAPAAAAVAEPVDRSCSAASPPRWRSSRPTARTAISPRGSTRSARSRSATRRSTRSGSSRS